MSELFKMTKSSLKPLKEPKSKKFLRSLSMNYATESPSITGIMKKFSLEKRFWRKS